MSKRKNRARNVGHVPPQPTAVILPMEKPQKPLVKYSVSMVPMELLGSEALFNEFAPFLQMGCAESRDRYTPQWLWMMAMKDEMQIWAVLAGNKPAGVFVTTTQLYPATGLHVVQVIILGGDGILAAHGRIREALIAFKELRGCHRVEWVGREGLARLWPGSERIGIACEVE